MAGCGLEVEERAVGDGDGTGAGVDGEAAAGVVGEAVGDAVGRIRIAGQCRHPDVGAVCGGFGDGVGAGVAVGDGADVELLGVADRDGEGFGIGVAGTVGDLDGDVVGACGFVVQQRAVGDRDLAGAGIDGEAPAGIVDEAVGEALAGIGVARDDAADRGAAGRVLSHRAATQGQILGGLVQVVEVDREALDQGARIGAHGLNRDAVTVGRLVVQQAAVGDGDRTGHGIDGEAPAGVVQQAVGIAHGSAGQARPDAAHVGAIGRVLVDRAAGHGNRPRCAASGTAAAQAVGQVASCAGSQGRKALTLLGERWRRGLLAPVGGRSRRLLGASAGRARGEHRAASGRVGPRLPEDVFAAGPEFGGILRRRERLDGRVQVLLAFGLVSDFREVLRLFGRFGVGLSHDAAAEVDVRIGDVFLDLGLLLQGLDTVSKAVGLRCRGTQVQLILKVGARSGRVPGLGPLVLPSRHPDSPDRPRPSRAQLLHFSRQADRPI